MVDDLPLFRKVSRSYASKLIHSALSGPRGPALIELLEFEDNHFRAVFSAAYFQLPPGADAPSKSQWNTLKKKLKRRNRLIFVFRKYGEVGCGPRRPQAMCYYLDFGFMLD